MNPDIAAVGNQQPTMEPNTKSWRAEKVILSARQLAQTIGPEPFRHLVGRGVNDADISIISKRYHEQTQRSSRSIRDTAPGSRPSNPCDPSRLRT